MLAARSGELCSRTQQSSTVGFVISWVRYQLGFFETRFGHFRGRIFVEHEMLIARKLRDGCFFVSAASNVGFIVISGGKIEKNLNLENLKNHEN